MRVAVVQFPGSNCDDDCVRVTRQVLGAEVFKAWHADTSLGKVDAVILPGGFSYGDYLRCGAIAARSPLMAEVRAFAARGGPVLGICNGFQVLAEAGLLPGVLRRNVGLDFICEDVWLTVEGRDTPFTRGLPGGRRVRVPIAHHDGNYYADAPTLARLEGEGRVVFRYCDAGGAVSSAANPNGSVNNIAGVCSPDGNVVGMMPHPERCAEARLGNVDGRLLFEALGRALA